MLTDSCEISGSILAADGTPMKDVEVRIRVTGGYDAIRGDSAYSSAVVATFTNEDGVWSVTVPQGAVFRLRIPECDVDALGIAPRALEADVKDLPLAYDPPR